MCDVRRLVFSARDPWIHVVGVVGQDMYERGVQLVGSGAPGLETVGLAAM